LKDDDILGLYLLKLEISLKALKLLSVGSAAAAVVVCQKQNLRLLVLQLYNNNLKDSGFF
jgi:hypothetical protein